MFGKKYFLDEDLQFKIVKPSLKQVIIRISMFLLLFLAVGVLYKFSYFKFKETTIEERVLMKEIEDLKFQYTILNNRFKNSLKTLECLQMTDNNTYRVILGLDSIERTFSNPSIGGIDRYQELRSYENSEMMINSLNLLDLIKNKVAIQQQSYDYIEERTREWIREMAHLPIISPVNTIIKRGDGVKFREKHPILGRPVWHHGQDFIAPYGTEVYATGAGRVKIVGRDEALGNYIVIDHDYGYETYYGHLSAFKVTKGQDVKRGDLIGLTGSTGWSTGPHLHYQINLYGKYQNPLFFFNDDLTEDEYIAMIDTLTARFKLK